MKKVISLVCSVVILLTCCLPAFAADSGSAYGSYKHVVIIGVDGAGAFFKQASTPNCDRIFSEHSATTYDCKAEFKTVSAQNWGAMLLGVSYLRHGLTNSIVGAKPRTSSEKYPSVFRLIRESRPDAALASFCNWNPINVGIIENDISVYEDTGDDPGVRTKILAYLAMNNPMLMFVQFDSVDAAGHGSGYGSAGHLAAITEVDSYIGEIYDFLSYTGRMDDTLFIVVSDHGGTPGTNGGGGGHGGATLAERKVFFGIRGKNVIRSEMPYGTRNRDVAAVTLYALGIEPGKDMTAKVPGGVFEGGPSGSAGFFDTVADYLNGLLKAISDMFSSLL